MPTNAPYSGGFAPGAELFAVDGDFTTAAPCSPPDVSLPFKGDSIPDNTAIILMDSSGAYDAIPLGSGYNVQPFAANQSAIVFEQEFMVAIANHVPLPLNTPYDTAWSIGWQGTYVGLEKCFLVEEGPLEHIGAGIAKFQRKYANLPPTRNLFESYAHTIPAFTVDDAQTLARNSSSKIVASRIQLDYFVYDSLDLLTGIIPGVFPGTHRLDATTGIFPTGLILPEMAYFEPDPFFGTPGASPLNAIEMNLIINFAGVSEALVDPTSISAGSNPTSSQYKAWIAAKYEIVAEASSLSQWMGNIYQRQTRFVVAF